MTGEGSSGIGGLLHVSLSPVNMEGGYRVSYGFTWDSMGPGR